MIMRIVLCDYGCGLLNGSGVAFRHTNLDRLRRSGIIMGSVATFWHNHWIGYHIPGIFKRLLTDLAYKISDRRSNSMLLGLGCSSGSPTGGFV
uniref:Uncharacterized protein n=1 Tax=Solanum tuberosum TaxID=4113 RepID=M1DWM3_SOLTU